MSEIPEFHKEVSEQSGASFVESDQAIEDIKYVQDLAEFGLPVDIKSAHETIVELSRIEYDEFMPQQTEAKKHIDAAIQLFTSSYHQSVDYTIQEANRIIAVYPDIHYPHYGKVTAVRAVWQKDGSAHVDFQTGQTQTTN